MRLYGPIPLRQLLRRIYTRVRCAHPVMRKMDDYCEDIHGHYHEYLQTLHVTLWQCPACGKRRRMTQEVLPVQVPPDKSTPPVVIPFRPRKNILHG